MNHEAVIIDNHTKYCLTWVDNLFQNSSWNEIAFNFSGLYWEFWALRSVKSGTFKILMDQRTFWVWVHYLDHELLWHQASCFCFTSLSVIFFFLQYATRYLYMYHDRAGRQSADADIFSSDVPAPRTMRAQIIFFVNYSICGICHCNRNWIQIMSSMNLLDDGKM